MDKLNVIYKAILNSIGLVVTDDGVVGMQFQEGNKTKVLPALVKEKTLVVPTREVLADTDWNSCVAFHPLHENTVRGESSVMARMRKLAGNRIHTIFHELLVQLMQIASDPEEHSKLSPIQSEFLSKVPNADSKMLDALIAICKKCGNGKKDKLTSFYIKKGGKKGEISYSRLGVVNVPILEEFDRAEGRVVLGVKLRVNDVKQLRALIDFILPDANDGMYYRGSNSMHCPTFLAFCKTYIAVAKRLNEVVRQFSDVLEDPETLLIDTEWEDNIDSLPDMRGLIPNLDSDEVTHEEANETLSRPKSAAPSSPTTQAQPAAEGKKGNTFTDMMNATQPVAPAYAPAGYGQPQQQPYYQQQPPQGGYNPNYGNPPPQQYYQPAGYPPQQPAQYGAPAPQGWKPASRY